MGTSSKPPGKKGKGRPPGMRPAARPIVSYKGTPEYAAWFRGFAAAMGKAQVEVIEEAIRRFAKGKKYEPPPGRL